MLDHIRNKVESGQRLSAEEGQWLFRPDVDLHAVGQLADAVRCRLNPGVAYYNINSHLNPTNICVYHCPLCAFSSNANESRAYDVSDAQVQARAHEADSQGCTELHVVSGVHPEKKLDWYVHILRLLHEAAPRIHLKAWTAVEIAWLVRREGLSIQRVLEAMVEAGLGSLPGGGAEIFAPDVRRQISPGKANAETWLAVHRTAHRLGLRSNATMLCGHVETAADRIDHLLRLRELQDETGGFQTFIPLIFHPENTQLAHLRRQTGLEDLRLVAVSRLMLDNFPHVKAYWISLGVGTAQVALRYGADDLDGTVRHEEIHHDAGAGSPDALTVEELRGLIAEAGFEPVERDSLYRRVQRDGANWSLAAEIHV